MKRILTAIAIILLMVTNLHAADIWFDVDTALSKVPVNCQALTDNSDFYTRETAIAYNETNMDLVWNFCPTGGTCTQTAVTPTTAGDYDWAHQGDGMYVIEIPASGGASINNDTEGVGWFTGQCDGVLHWKGPYIGLRKASMNNVMIDDGTAQDNFEDAFDGTTGYGFTGCTIPTTTDVTNTVSANITQVGSDAIQDNNDGRLEVNVEEIADAAVSTSSAQLGINVVQIEAADPTDTINAQCDTALSDINLDHLVKSAVDTNWATTVHLDSVIGHVADPGTSATFDRTTDSLETIRNQGDSAWITATGFSTHNASDVQAEMEEDEASILDDISDKLPTNYIMGSSVQTDKDDEIDDIKLYIDRAPF